MPLRIVGGPSTPMDRFCLRGETNSVAMLTDEFGLGFKIGIEKHNQRE